MGVTLKGFDKHYKKLKGAMPEMNKSVPKVLAKYGAKMVQFARQNHRFVSQTGQLERSITYKVDRKNWVLEFYIDGVRLYSAGYNYGWIQHDGSGVRYKRGRFSPSVSPKLKNGGVASDHFMVRAWDEYADELTAELEKLLIKVLD